MEGNQTPTVPQKVSTDVILDTLKRWVEEKQVIDAHTWVNSALKLNVLIGSEHDRLYELEQAVAELKVSYINGGDSVAKAKAKTDASDIHRMMMTQKGRLQMIEENIRLAKTQARLKDSEYRNQ